jgi:hypothetical protein
MEAGWISQEAARRRAIESNEIPDTVRAIQDCSVQFFKSVLISQVRAGRTREQSYGMGQQPYSRRGGRAPVASSDLSLC